MTEKDLTFLVACSQGNLGDAVRAWEEGAKPGIWNNTAIELAARQANLPLVQFLVERADVDLRIKGEQLLVDATRSQKQNSEKIIQYLVEQAKVTVNSGNGAALRTAAERGSYERVCLLIRLGADPHLLTADDYQVMRSAGHWKIHSLLLSYG